MLAFGWLMQRGVAGVVKSLDPGARGHHIESPLWVYAAGVLGFLLMLALAVLLIRLLAYLVMFGSVVGGIGCMCYLLNSKMIQTWEQLGVAILVVGGVAASACVTAEIFTGSRGGTVELAVQPQSTSSQTGS